MRIVCRPLTDWPGQLRTEAERAHARFTATWSDTQDLLVREAEYLAAKEIVIQLAVPDTEIRIDGWPYARAKARHPGVTIVLPDTREGRLSWSTDRYADSIVYVSARVRQSRSRDPNAKGGTVSLPGWQANVRAVGLSLEALRTADRHGIMAGRQYAGFRELPAGAPSASGGQEMTVEQAATFLAGQAVVIGDSPDDVIRPWGITGKGYMALIDDSRERKRAYTLAAKRLHPDVGGDESEFARLQLAMAVMEMADV